MSKFLAALTVLAMLSFAGSSDAAMRVGPRRVLQVGKAKALAASSEVQVLGTQIGTGLADTGTAAPLNLALSSQSFNNGDWVVNPAYVVGGQGAVTVIDNATTAPDSTVTAASVTETTENASHSVLQGLAKAASSTQYTFSASVKQGLRTRAVLAVQSTGAATDGAYTVINLATCTQGVAAAVYGTGFSGASATFSSQSNGFCRGSLTFTSNASPSLEYLIQTDNGSGTGAVSNSFTGNASGVAIYTWGANLNTGASIQTYGKTTNSGLVAANIGNQSTTSFWGTLTANAWVGVDAGASVAWKRWRFAPRPGNTGPGESYDLDYETLMQGAVIQTCTSSTCTSPTTVDTVPATPFYPRYWLNERTLSATSQYIRLLPNSAAFGSVSNLQFFASISPAAGSVGFNAAPVSPVISPWGGMVPSGSKLVTITSATAQASIRYTTNGSTPACPSTGTLYSAPFSLTPGSATTVKAISCWAALSTPSSNVVSAIFHNYSFAPRDDWFDNRGNLIEAHGGGVIWDPTTSLYYWVGANANQEAPPWVPSLTFPLPRRDIGPMLYSSPNGLAPWTFVGNILPMVTGNSAGGFPWISLTRVHILPPSACGGSYVLWGHLGDKDLGIHDLAAIATASSITGPWTWVGNINPDGVFFGDDSLYADATGAYVVYVRGDTANGIRISKLASNCQSVATSIAITATTREAPVLVQNTSNGNYFLITSTQIPYDGTVTANVRYIVNSTATTGPLSGAWGAMPGTVAYAADPIGTPYNGQPAFSLRPQGSSQLLLGMDFWTPAPLYNSRQVWLPVTFPTGTTLQIGIPANWTIP